MKLDPLQAYASWIRRSKNPLTATAYLKDVKRFLDYVGKGIDEVTVLDVSLYFDELEKRGIKPRSLNRYSWALRSFFETIGKTELARLIPTPVYEATMPVWLERSQVEEILAKAKPGLPKTLLATAYDLALRQAEVPLLNRDWFYVKDKSMKVKRLKRRGSAPSESMLPVSDYVVDLLQEWLSSRQDGSEALFVVRGGQYGGNWRRIASRTVNYIYREAAKRAKVNPDKYGFHSFSRHSRGTHLAIEMIQSQGQVDLTRLAKFMGHVSTSSTLLYVHLATIYLAGRQ